MNLFLFAAIQATIFFLKANNNHLEKYKRRILSGILIHFGSFFFGYLIVQLHEPGTSTIPQSNHQDNTTYKCQLISNWEIKGKRMNAEALILSEHENGKWVRQEEKITIMADSNLISPPQKDVLFFIRGSLKEISSKKNPDDFDYKKMMLSRGIKMSFFLRENNFRISSKKIPKRITSIAESSREFLSQILRKHSEDPVQHGIVSALVLGEKGDIDQETMDAFSATGTVHVLSVSGMHVGMIYLVLAYFFGKAGKTIRVRIISTLIILITLWLYAFLTGLSPSVLRAVSMLSLIVVGNGFGMRPNSINILAGSCFVLLCYDPFLLYNIGFQLSYLAVLGIIVIHPVIYEKIYFQSRFLDKIWSLTSLSLSAQLLTFPLASYYFGSFPNYFLISNLVIIPLATGVLFLGIAMLLLDAVPMINKGIEVLLQFNIKILTKTVQWFSQLPGAKGEFFLHGDECILIYLSIIFILFSFHHFGKYSLRIALTLILLTIVFRILVQEKEVGVNRLMIAHESGGILIQHETGTRNDVFYLKNEEKSGLGKIKTLHTGSIKRMEKAPIFHIQSIGTMNQELEWSFRNFIFSNSVLCIPHWKIALAESKRKFKKKLSIDILLVSGLRRFASVSDLENFHTKLIVLDAICSPYRIKKWKKAGEEKGIPVWDIKKNGALVITYSNPSYTGF